MEVGFGIPSLVVGTGVESRDGCSEGGKVDAGCFGERSPQLVLFTSGVLETLSDLRLVVETGFGRERVDLIEKVDQIQGVSVEGGRAVECPRAGIGFGFAMAGAGGFAACPDIFGIGGGGCICSGGGGASCGRSIL